MVKWSVFNRVLSKHSCVLNVLNSFNLYSHTKTFQFQCYKMSCMIFTVSAAVRSIVRAMASPAQPVSGTSWVSDRSRTSSRTSSKKSSFGSWGSRKPRDSLEKMRQRNNSVQSVAELPQAPHHRLLMSVRNFSVQVMRGVREEEEEEEEDEESDIDRNLNDQEGVHPPLNRSFLCDRYPKGKASLLVFILNVIASYAFGTAMILNILQTKNPTIKFMYVVFQPSITRLVCPISGFIADVYIGRYRMIRAALCVLFIGYFILVVSFLLKGQLPKTHDVAFDIVNVIAFILITAGSGAFESSLIPFGVDQLEGASSEEISSYFYYFYFARNLGTGLGLLVYGLVSFIISHSDDSKIYDVFQPLVTVVILTLGVLLHQYLSHWYFNNRPGENPVKLVLKVLCYAAFVKRHIPVRRRAFRYGEEKKKRIDLAKVEYDGEFSGEKVEDVKAFCRICLILFTLIPAHSALRAVGIHSYISCAAIHDSPFLVLQFELMLTYETNSSLIEYYPNHFLENNNLYSNVYSILNVLFVSLSLPIVNYCFIPCFPKITIRARIGAGLVVYCIGSVVLIIIHVVACGQDWNGAITKTQLFYLSLPIAIFGFAEALTDVSS